MRADLPQGHVALLLTDIEGSTRLLHQLGAQGYAKAQAEHRDVLRQSLQLHNGVEVDTQGDAFFYAFPTTIDCLRGAVAGTRALHTFPWSHAETVKVRMGMHAGEPQPTDEGYVGMVVNIAARVSAIGHGGQILLSWDAHKDISAQITLENLSVRDLGKHRLKDIDTPQQLFQVVIPELPMDFPPPRSAEQKPNNLPTPLTPFIGRALQVEQVLGLLKQPKTRAVTLLGPGGAGKSRLGLRVADEMLHSLDDGAFFVSLATVRDVDLVLPAIASALSLKEEPGSPLQETLVNYLQDKQLLLLLDNFEQVQGAARQLAGILSACPSLKFLVTSRQPMRVSGERGYPVPPLSLPDADASLEDIEAVASFECVRLFVERAEEVQWDFELTAGNVADVVAICRKLDALPLAIELATARLFEMDTEKLLAALDQRLNVLTDGAFDLHSHQQTLRDLVAWSYDLLQPAEQKLWRRIAIFDGGGELSAVKEICDTDDEYVFPRDIDALVAKSLLNLEFDGVGSQSADNDRAGQRVNMLQTLREYALEKLDESPDREAVAVRHSRFYCEWAVSAAARQRSPDVEVWLRYLDLDQANFKAVMARGLDQEVSVQEGQTEAVKIAGSLWFYWYQRGLYSEGRGWLDRAIALEGDPVATAGCLLGLANLERIQNNLPEAKTNCERALGIFRQEQQDDGIADALSQLGAICEYMEDFESAETYLDEAVLRFRKLGSQGRLSFTLVLLGALKQLRGDVDGAQEDYEESLALARALGDKNYIATSLVNLGEIMQLKQATDLATQYFRESLQIFYGLGVRNAVAYCLEMLASIDTSSSRFQEAAISFAAAAKLREAINAPLEAFNRVRYESDIAACREGLGDKAFETAWRQGHDLELKSVVETAQFDHELPSAASPT